MSKDLVSIIIPTYNRAHLIGETLDSVLAQTYANWECIVVDDGSMDYTVELMQFYCDRDSRFHFMIRKNNLRKGASQCRNIGLETALGKYLIFLDSDDILFPDCLSGRLSYATIHRNFDFYIFPVRISFNAKEYFDKTLPNKSEALKMFLTNKIPWQTTSTLWDINFLKLINGFHPSYPRLNDVEIHIRSLLKSNNYKIAQTYEPDFIYNGREPIDYKVYAEKYYESLMIFIPSICEHLKLYKRDNEIKHLKGFLIDYLKKSYAFLSLKANLKLISIFYRNNVYDQKVFIVLYSQFCLYTIFKFLSKKLRQSNFDILES